MSDIPSLPDLPATASATGKADLAVNDHHAAADVAATQDAVSSGVTATGPEHSVSAGAHASADGAAAQVSANGHDVSVDTAGDASTSALDAIQDKLGELGANVGGALDVGATATVNEIVNVALHLRAMFEGALPF